MKNEMFKSDSGMGGVFEYELRRNGVIIDTWDEHNLIPNAGLDHNNNVVLDDATRVTEWHIGLYSNTYAPQADDLYTHIGSRFTEIQAEYSEATRPAFVPDAAGSVGGVLANAVSRSLFTFTSDATVAGAIFVSDSEKGDSVTPGAVLFAASAHTPSRSIRSGDELLVKYTFTGTSI